MEKILCMADLHFSSVRPMCRTDEDWIETQRRYLEEIKHIIYRENVDTVVIAGDIFDTPVVSPTIVNMVLSFILELRSKNRLVYFCAGNHDLPYHTVERIEQSSFGALDLIRNKNAVNDMVQCIDFDEKDAVAEKSVIAIHRFVVQGESAKPPIRGAITASELVELYPSASCIIVGDNHEAWYKRIGNTIVINCGTLLQRTAAEAKRLAGCWVYDMREGSAVLHDLSYLSINCIDTSYLEDIKEREENRGQYEALLSELRDGVENKYDFVALLNEYVESHKKDMDEGTYNILMETLNYIRSK